MELKRHSLNVSRLAMLIGIELNLKPSELKNLSMSALYHDIGKSKISNRILNKKEKLSNIEMELIKCHSSLGADILKERDMNLDIVEAVLCHHERWDGKGYPNGRERNSIPLYSRIIAIADAYDAMTHNRPYSKSITHTEAMNEIYRCSGSQFDPRIVKIFESLNIKEECFNISQ